MKKISWCEQSGLLQERADLENDLHLCGVDYFRFNWRYGQDDPFANVCYDGDDKLSWSRGRELLYDTAKKNDYDYYVFADDDLFLDRPVPDFVQRIRDVLDKYHPCILTVRGNSWHENYVKNFRTQLVSIFIVDLQFQCLSRESAEFAFPVKFDGGWATLWYPMLNCNKTPGSVVNVRDMLITNSNHTAGGEYGGIENNNVKDIWNRSGPYMSSHAKFLSKLIGYRHTILILNLLYAFVAPLRVTNDKRV